MKQAELTILALVPEAPDLASLAVGDIDGDGQLEIVSGGGIVGTMAAPEVPRGGLYWFRPATRERGLIARGNFNVGIALEDLDGDGIPEVVTGTHTPPRRIFWFKRPPGGGEGWPAYDIDPDLPGNGCHDMRFVDLDGDGVRELVANDIEAGLYIYRPGEDVTRPWQRHVVQSGCHEEGLACADVDGDGRLEILSGPRLYAQPAGGPFAGPWVRTDLAPSFREMCRCLLIDVNGDGLPEPVMVESEYMDGRWAWFERTVGTGGRVEWIPHLIGSGYVFAHSLWGQRDEAQGKVRLFLAEMAEGGWAAPHNPSARLVQAESVDGGRTWNHTLLYQGEGTHEATVVDLDGDGALEVVGKQWRYSKVQVWKEAAGPSPVARFRHRLLDRDKPYTGVDILPVDVDGDGRKEIACGAWWYKGPGWERREIPGIIQVIHAFDVDRDGREELIALEGPSDAKGSSPRLSNRVCWLKPVDPAAGVWTKHEIGTGAGDWPHGVVAAPLLSGGGLGLVLGYHNARDGVYPELFTVPAQPAAGPWPRRTLAEIPYGEEFAAADLDGDGLVDLVAGGTWLRNLGDGTFRPIPIAEPGFDAARASVADINGDGRPDVVLGEFALDFKRNKAPLSRVVWFENPGDAERPWAAHVIDKIRCPHSLAVADLDRDGEPEIVCGEHDPFFPYRSRSRLFVYKKADRAGLSWKRYLLDDRFEHHCGTKVFEIEPGRWAIVSHGWKDARYVHLWEEIGA